MYGLHLTYKKIHLFICRCHTQAFSWCKFGNGGVTYCNFPGRISRSWGWASKANCEGMHQHWNYLDVSFHEIIFLFQWLLSVFMNIMIWTLITHLGFWSKLGIAITKSCLQKSIEVNCYLLSTLAYGIHMVSTK